MNYKAVQKHFLDEVMREFKDCYIPLKDRKIVLFGAGSYGKMMVQALTDIGMKENILAISDNDSKKWGGYWKMCLCVI